MENITLRSAAADDAARLRGIYAPYVDGSAVTFEYQPPTEAEFAARITDTLKRYPYIVAEIDGRAVGFAYARAFRPRAAYDHAAETTIYIVPEAHGIGVGRALYERLIDILRAQNVTDVYACIATTDRAYDPNLTDASPKFHARLGFSEVGKFPACGFKFGRWYDMIWMGRQIAPRSDAPPEFIPYPKLADAQRV